MMMMMTMTMMMMMMMMMMTTNPDSNPNLQIALGRLVLRGCLFHYTSAIWKFIQEIGLVPLYRNDTSGLRVFCKKFMALPFLPPHIVIPMYSYLVRHKWPSRIALNRVAFNAFLTYIENTWLRNPTFPLELSNVFYRDDHRTNNSLESKHAGFGRIFGLHKPLWQFLTTLIQLHTTELTTQRVHTFGNPPTQREAVYRNREEHLANLKSLYIRGQLSHYMYLCRVSHFLR